MCTDPPVRGAPPPPPGAGASDGRARRPRADDGLFIVGLVGRAGSGKSTVARALAADGARVIEADRLGHEVTDGDPEVRAALAAEYGADVYRPDGALDRARVAARVFADPEARARLDRLVHPRIVERIRRTLDAWRAAGHRGVVVVDAALMLEWGLERACDAIVAVTAPEEEQVARLAAARGWTPEQARARLAAQRTNERFAAAADAVLDNRGSPEDLARAARDAVARLRAARA
uniref:Dephospho-CoA kinase n=1 Tax=Eiseniibacteriota bacterium TaxID=2212470 RepID=A0A832I085_UNCEI